MPPFLQGLLLLQLARSLQVAPINGFEQAHTVLLPCTLHVPPFQQGFDKQRFSFAANASSQLGPLKF